MVLSIFFLFVFLLLFFIARNSLNDDLAKVILYCYLGYWGISMVISPFNVFKLNEVSASTYGLLLLNVCSFTFGMVAYKERPIICCDHVSQHHDMGLLLDKLLTNKIYWLFLIVADVFLFYVYQKQLAFIAVYSALDIRQNFDELIFEGNSMMGLFNNLVIDPLSPVILVLSCYAILYKRDRIIPLCLSLVYLVLSAMKNGSRGGLLKILIYSIFLLLISETVSLGNKKRTKHKFGLFVIVLALGVAVISVISYMTAMRMYRAEGFSLETIQMGFSDLMEQLVTYSVAPFRALDYSFDHNYLESIGGYKYGSCTFGFVDGFLSLIFKKIGLAFISSSSIVVGFLQNEWIYVGGTRLHNFAYTSVFMHYADFGIFGVAFFPFLFGYIVRVFLRKFRENNNPFLMVLLAELFFIALYTIFSWGMYRGVTAFTFIYIYVLYKVFEKNKRRFYI